MVKKVSNKGFTLVETLVSVLIAAILLGAATVASRTVGQSAEVSQQRVQMNSIADTIFTHFKLLQQADHNFYSNVVGAGSTPVYGQFFDSGGVVGSTAAIDWVTLLPTGYASKYDVYLPFTVKDTPYTIRSDAAYFFNSTTGVVEGSHSPFGSSVPVTSLVAVCQHPDSQPNNFAVCQDSPSGTTNNYFVRNGSNFLLRSPWDGPSNLKNLVPDLNSDTSWTAFAVSVSLRLVSTLPYTTYDSPTGPAKNALQSAGYIATVQIANYHNPSHQLMRTAYLTAWQ